MRKTTHWSEGKSSGQFRQAPHRIILTSLLNMREFQYGRLYANPGVVIAWAEMSIVLDELTQKVNSLKFFSNQGEKTKEILGIVKYCLIMGINGYHNATTTWSGWLTDTSQQVSIYAPFPLEPQYKIDIRPKAKQHWEYHLSWLQHWHDASAVPCSVHYGRACQSDSQLVVIIAYLINHVVEDKVELEKIWANTGWYLCRPLWNQE